MKRDYRHRKRDYHHPIRVWARRIQSTLSFVMFCAPFVVIGGIIKGTLGHYLNGGPIAPGWLERDLVMLGIAGLISIACAVALRRWNWLIDNARYVAGE